MMQSLFSSRRSSSPMAPTAAANTSQSRLQEIILLLHNKRESLAACRSRLSLTSRQIQDICSSLYSSSCHSQTESSSLLNLLGNVRAIKIVPDPASLSLPLNEIVNLSPFHQLTHLEVRNVAMSRVIHLSQLRSQLRHLVLYACLDSLDEVLQECGGDKCTDSFLWSELASLHVTSCQAIDLGTGLQLTPWLKTLDLTFNQLTDNSVQSLSTLLTLHSLTLDFNSLQRIPVLAPSARTSLKVLHLRQNQLDSLCGVEQLVSLEELDVGYNCISNGEALSALSFLTHLVKLNLEFNPLSYVKDYRLVVLRRVSASINRKKFRLDETPLSSIDKGAVGTLASLYSALPRAPEMSATLSALRQQQQTVVISVADESVDETTRQAVLAAGNEQQNSYGSDRNGPTPSPAKTSNATTPVTPSSTLSSVKRRKASRMREVEIVDPAVPQTTTTTNSNAFLKPDWVAADATPAVTEKSTDAGHLHTKQQVEELRRVFGQENWLTSQAGNKVRLLLGWQETESDPTPRTEERRLLTVADPVVSASTAADDDSTSQPAESESKDDASIVVLQSERDVPAAGLGAFTGNDCGEGGDVEDDLYVFIVQRQMGDSQEERLLTVSAAYLCEKDTTSGATLSCWKRSSLQCVKVLCPSSLSRPVVQVQLVFNPAYRSSNEPIYDMEQDDFAEIENIVASSLSTASDETTTVETRQWGQKNDSPRDDVMSCMKCDGQFPLVRAAVRLRTAVASPLLKGQLEEYSVCPYCSSDMVFAVEQNHHASIVSSRRTDVSGSASESTSSCSNQSGSDVVIAANEPYSPGGDSSDTSEEGSVEVVDKTMRLDSGNAVVDYSTPNSNNGYHYTSSSAVAKSLSSRSHSSKSSSSQASHTNNSSVRPSGSSSVRSASSVPFTYSYADFSQVDHRLRLFCEMFLLGHQTEEFHGLIKAELVTMNAGPTDQELEPMPALLVVTSQKVYFLRITGSSTSEQPEKWLNLESSYPLGQLVNMLTVIGNQGLVLKFGNNSPHLVLLRDQRRTKNVTHFLTDIFEKSGLNVPPLRSDLMADQWLALDGLVRGDQDTVSTGSADGETGPTRFMPDSNSRVFLFCLACRVEWSNGNVTNVKEQQHQAANYSNAALMVTSDRLALVRGDPRWLTSHQVQFRTWGVALLSLQQLVNLVSLESFVSKPEQIRCYFLDEASGMEEKWTVSLATREAVDQLIEAVRYPWEAVFSVELEINELDE